MLNFDIEFQRQVISAALDDFSPNSALPGLHGGQYGSAPQEWREAVVEFVRSMLLAELIAPLHGRAGYESKTVQEICDVLHYGDPDNGLDAELAWDGIHFAGTEKLLALLQTLELANWDARNGGLSSPLGEALAQLNVARQ